MFKVSLWDLSDLTPNKKSPAGHCSAIENSVIKLDFNFANIAQTQLVFVFTSPVSVGFSKNIYHHAPNGGTSVLHYHFMKNSFEGTYLSFYK